jgi:predicted amidohydrolase YtcJ
MGSAYAMGREKELGSLEVGKWADLVVLSGEINSKSEIELTMVGGKVIFEKKR